jgi:RA like domain
VTTVKAAKQVVRVHFMDNSVKAFAIDPNASAAQLRDLVIDRRELKESRCFFLFEKRDDWGRFRGVHCFEVTTVPPSATKASVVVFPCASCCVFVVVFV